MRVAIPFAAAFILAGCASMGGGIADLDLPRATATIEVARLTPEPGSVLDSGSVLTADVTYTIDNFQPGVHYYLAPTFASNEGEGQTFSAGDLLGSRRLTTANGTVPLRYAVSRELRSHRLARPPKVWIYLMERIGERSTRVLAMSPAYEYD